MSRRKPILKKFLPRTLFGRSLMILITPVLLIQIFTTFMFFDRHWSKMTSRMAFGVAGEITMIANLIEGEESGRHIQNVIDYAAQYLDMNVVFYEDRKVQKPQHEGFGYDIESMVSQTLHKEIRAMLRRPFSLDLDLEEKWIEVVVQLENGVLEISLPGRRLFSSSGYIFLLWMIGTSFILLVIAILFMRNQIRPIRKLAIAAERFGKGRKVGSFRPSGAREVRQAAQAFIDMQRRIKRQIEQRTAMLAGVSHDLRTPLTRMKLQLAMLEQTPDVKAMKEDIEHMEHMIEGYLEFVRGEGNETAVYTNIKDLAESAAGRTRPDHAEIRIDVPPDLNAMLRPVAFERCLLNLINNAAYYADQVFISAAAEEGALILKVDDNGSGIPEARYEDVFKPFYRLDESRRRETGGVGLGLPIVKDIVNAHGGKIELGRSPQGGLRVTIKLPL